MISLPTDLKTRKRLARESTDEHVLEVLARDERISIKKLVMANPHTGEATLLRLMSEADFILKEEYLLLQGRDTLPLTVLASVLQHGGYEAPGVVVVHKNASPWLIRLVAANGGMDQGFMRRLMLRAPNIPDDVVREILRRDDGEAASDLIERLAQQGLISTMYEEEAAYIVLEEAQNDNRYFLSLEDVGKAARVYLTFDPEPLAHFGARNTLGIFAALVGAIPETSPKKEKNSWY